MKRFLRFAPFFAMLLVAIEIAMTTQLAGSGKDVRHMDMAIDRLSADNQILIQQVASASSLLTIDAQAKALGFIEPTATHVITMGSDTLRVALGYPQ